MLLIPVVTIANELLYPYPEDFARSSGMGDAYRAVRGGPVSVFYNPAHLSNYKGFAFTLAALSIRLDENYLGLLRYIQDNSSLFKTGTAGDIGKRELVMQTADKFNGQWFGFSVPVHSCVLWNEWAFLYRLTPNSGLQLDEGIVFPFVRATYAVTQEVAVSRGLSLTQSLSAGVSLKYIVQARKDTLLTFAALEDLDAWRWEIPSSEWKQAVGADIGILLQPDPSSRFSFVWRDIFLRYPGQDVPHLSIGWAGRHDRHQFAVDYVNIFDQRPVLARLKMGYDYLIPFMETKYNTTAVRCGINGGYLSAGLGLRLFSLIVLEYATTAEETGSYLGQQGQRHHDLSLRISYHI